MNKTTETLLAHIEKLEAANKLAEEALDKARGSQINTKYVHADYDKSIKALAQPVKQEPVAWVDLSEGEIDKLIDDNQEAVGGYVETYAASLIEDVIALFKSKNAEPVKREWVELKPWQLCEIEERIGLPIDSHDFETIGNAYIAAFKEKNK